MVYNGDEEKKKTEREWREKKAIEGMFFFPPLVRSLVRRVRFVSNPSRTSALRWRKGEHARQSPFLLRLLDVDYQRMERRKI